MKHLFKKSFLYASLLVLLLALVSVSVGLSAGLLNLPPDPVTIEHGEWLANLPYSTLAITLSNVPAGYDVTNGVYNGWCIEDNRLPTPPAIEFVLFEPSGGAWGSVNWLLNNRAGYDGFDIQVAIWLLLGTNNNPVSPAAQELYEAALLHADFVPAVGQLAAVRVFDEPEGIDNYQDTIIEVVVPEPSTFTFSGNVYEGELGDTSNPLAGVTVTLIGSNTPDPAAGTPLGSALTDESGAYSISTTGNVYAYYFIVEQNPAGYISVGAVSPAGSVIDPDTIQFTAPLGGQALGGNNFWDALPLPPTFTFSGGVYVGEVGDTSTPLPGVTVTLVGSNTPDPAAGTTLGTDLTDETGAYAIDLVGDAYLYYFLLEQNLAGYISVGALSPAGTVVDPDTIQFASPLEGLALNGNNFWDALPLAYEFTGSVYAGQLGDFSTPLEGVTVSLYGSNLPYPVQNPDLIDTALTDASGAYNLQLGSDTYRFYLIVQQNLPGYDSVGAQSIDGAEVALDVIQFETPLEGQNLTQNNFWDILTESAYVFSGYVYLGQPPDITQPIGGINIHLYGKNGSDQLEPISEATLIAITQTDTDGYYSIELANDQFEYYFITEQTPFGYFSAAAWSHDGTVLDVNTIRFTSPLSGQDLSGNIFWDDISACLVSFTGMVYSGELNDVSNPLAEVTINLYGSSTPELTGDAILIDSVLTDAGGTFRIPIQQDNYAYYFVVQQNLPGYTSVGVRHYSGTTINADVVRFTSPLPGQNMSAIRFWDLPTPADSVTITGQVLLGDPETGTAPATGKLVNLYGSNDGFGPMALLDTDLTSRSGAYVLNVGQDSYDHYSVVLQSQGEVVEFNDLQAGQVVADTFFYLPFPYRYFFPFVGGKP